MAEPILALHVQFGHGPLRAFHQENRVIAEALPAAFDGDDFTGTDSLGCELPAIGVNKRHHAAEAGLPRARMGLQEPQQMLPAGPIAARVSCQAG